MSVALQSSLHVKPVHHRVSRHPWSLHQPVLPLPACAPEPLQPNARWEGRWSEEFTAQLDNRPAEEQLNTGVNGLLAAMFLVSLAAGMVVSMLAL